MLVPLASAVGRRVSPLTVTLVGFLAGVATAVAAAMGSYRLALALWALNRILDGLDGTLARTSGRQSDLGGYLDIVLDFVVYAAIPIALVAAAPSLTLAFACLGLLGSFFVNAASWMYLAAILERRGAGARASGELTSVTMPAGLLEGAETVVFYSLFLLFPQWLVGLFAAMTALVLVTTMQRVAWAARHLPRPR